MLRLDIERMFQIAGCLTKQSRVFEFEPALRQEVCKQAT